ncbi:hypothetical protein BY996DRAFT_6541125 [Phakopsora pachyrhizi]|nr:hypothetical protein BY996DRAFT_6541125 [Phakopsora pachyrhizi]
MDNKFILIGQVVMSAESILLRVKVGKDGMEYFDAGPSISEYRTGVDNDWILMRQTIMELMAVQPRMGMEHIMEIVIEVLAGALDEADDNKDDDFCSHKIFVFRRVDSRLKIIRECRAITKLDKDTEIDGSTFKVTAWAHNLLKGD